MAVILTLNMLNCFKDCERCIYISYHISDFVHQMKSRFTMEQLYTLPILYFQYHVCWCSGDFRSQRINRHGIDPKARKYSVSSIRRVDIESIFLAATKQLYKWYFPSVRLSVCPSVRLSVTPFWLCSHHRIIMKLSGVITNDQRKVHAKGQGQRSKIKVSQVTTQLNRFRTVTPVWIHIWWWNDACSLMLLRRGALLFSKVIRQISRSHGSKNRGLWPRLGVSGL